MPRTEQEAAAVQVGNKLYVFGGYAPGLIGTKTSNVLDLSTGQWSSIIPLPLMTSHMGAVTDGRFIYLVGGQVGNEGSTNIRNEAFVYDTQTNNYFAFPSLPEKREAGGLVYLNGTLHYFGGVTEDRNTVTGAHWMINVDSTGHATGTWTRKADMINPRDHLVGAVINGLIYAVGGEHDHATVHTQENWLSVYNPATDTWKNLAVLPEKKSHFEGGTLVVNGRIVIIGGRLDNDRISNHVDVYNPATNRWTTISTLPEARRGGAAAFYNGKLYYFSGKAMRGGSPTDTPDGLVGTIANLW
jgi:N-acetylneuraminic acid mutarotase